MFATVLYASDPELLTELMRPFGRHLLLRHGSAVTLLERAVVPSRPRLSFAIRDNPHVKMFKSPTLEAAQIDYLYSELSAFPGERAGTPRKENCPMHTQLHQIVIDMADRRGDAPALTFKDETVTYTELAQRAMRFAAGLQELGLARGDRVAIALDKRIETVVSVIGTSAAGGAFVPVNPVLKAGQVGHILGDCSVRVLVTTAQRLTLLREQLADSAVEHVIVVDAAPEDADLPVHEFQAFGAGASVVAPDRIDADMAAIFYTSGSTGKPKGVVLSHRNLLAGARQRQPVHR